METITLGFNGLFDAETGRDVKVYRTVVSDTGYMLYVADAPIRNDVLFLSRYGDCICFKKKGDHKLREGVSGYKGGLF